MTPTITLADLHSRRRADAQPIDVRSASEFAAGHIPGAINIPMDEIESRLEDLTPTRPLVLICQIGKRAEELLEFMQLADREKTLVADYSHGMQKKLALAAAVIHGPRILFLDEPFEGVDALAAGALKSLHGRMTERGVTIFLTSHVLEIVERLCSHVGIIHEGRLVAQGSIEELRRGVAAEAGEKKTLEQIFLSIVGQSGAEQSRLEELTWLT